MNLTSLLTAALAAAEVRHLGPRLARRALAYALLALAVLCLMVAAWRALEMALGPLLGPLVAAVVLALASAGVLFGNERAARRSPPNGKDLATLGPIVAPLAATVAVPLLLPVLKYMLHPKRIGLLAALGSMLAALNMVTKPSPARRRSPRPEKASG